MAAIASFVAGTFSVVALQLAAPLVARAALAFGPAEYFAFALLGVVLLANLTGGSRAKSLAMVVLGIMLSTVGMDPLGGTVRFTFDLAGAQAGLSFVAVTAGLFGVAEVLATMADPASTTPVARVRFRELYPNRDAYLSRWHAALDHAVEAGFILPEDAPAMKAVADETAATVFPK